MIRSIGCGKTIGHSGGLHGPGVELVLAGRGGSGRVGCGTIVYVAVAPGGVRAGRGVAGGVPGGVAGRREGVTAGEGLPHVSLHAVRGR